MTEAVDEVREVLDCASPLALSTVGWIVEELNHALIARIPRKAPEDWRSPKRYRDFADRCVKMRPIHPLHFAL